MENMGGFTDPQAAITFAATGGIPVRPVISGGKITSVQFERVYATALLPEGFYIGAVMAKGWSRPMWMPIDVSLKHYVTTPGIDLNTVVPFDAQAFVNQVQSTATINEAEGYVTNVNSALIQQTMQDYQTRVQDYISQNTPTATVGDIIGKREIKQHDLHHLYPTGWTKPIAGRVQSHTLPDSMKSSITFNIPDPIDTNNGLSYTTSLSELAGKKITLSFAPATDADRAVIASFQSTVASSSLPAYLINLKPELSIDGITVATGSATTMGAALSWTISLNEPGIGQSNVNNIITAGQFFGVGVDTGRIESNQLKSIKTKLLSTKTKLESGDYTNLTKNDLYGDILYSTIISYYSELDAMDEMIARQMNIVRYRAPSIGTFSIVLDSRDIFGVPVSINQKGMMMDVDRIMQAVLSKDGDMNKVKQYMLVSGKNSSALEHSVPEQLYSTPAESINAISTIKALQIANDQGVPIYSLNQSNIGTIAPLLQIDENAKTDIINAVNAGKVVNVSKSNITVGGWTGCGYSVIDAATGAGAYMISGGSSGSFFTLINSYFSSIADLISEYANNKYIGYDWLNFKKSKIISTMSAISKALVVVGFVFDIATILTDEKLSTTQKVEKIVVWTAAVTTMLKVGLVIAGWGIQLVPAMLIAIMAYLFITMLAIFIMSLIEEQGTAIYRINDRLRFAMGKPKYRS